MNYLLDLSDLLSLGSVSVNSGLINWSKCDPVCTFCRKNSRILSSLRRLGWMFWCKITFNYLRMVSNEDSSFFLSKSLLTRVDALWENLSSWSNRNFPWVMTQPCQQFLLGGYKTEPMCSMLIRYWLCPRLLLLLLLLPHLAIQNFSFQIWSGWTSFHFFSQGKLPCLNSFKSTRGLHNGLIILPEKKIWEKKTVQIHVPYSLSLSPCED